MLEGSKSTSFGLKTLQGFLPRLVIRRIVILDHLFDDT